VNGRREENGHDLQFRNIGRLKMIYEGLPEPIKSDLIADVRAGMEDALCAISGHPVGAAVYARKPGSTGLCGEVFGGGNIEIALSAVYHAEVVALLKALNAGYLEPLIVMVSSTDLKKPPAAMCAICRQHFMWVNPKCEVVVLGPDNGVRLQAVVEDTILYPYRGGGRIKRPDTETGRIS